nr:four helix bundle protein [Verrucomicrobiota bacterium JB025]
MTDEARELDYWLRLTRDGNVLSLEEIQAAQDQIQEIRKILTSIVKSSGS